MLATSATADVDPTVFHMSVKSYFRHCALFWLTLSTEKMLIHRQGLAEAETETVSNKAIKHRQGAPSEQKSQQVEVRQREGQTQPEACWELSTSL